MYKRQQFDYDILSKFSKQDEDNSLLRESIVSNTSNTENILTAKKQDPKSVNQNLRFYYTHNDKNIFALEMQHLYQDEDPFYNANLQTQPFVLTGYVPGQNRNDINQTRFVKTNKLDTKLDYYYMLTAKSNKMCIRDRDYALQISIIFKRLQKPLSIILLLLLMEVKSQIQKKFSN